MIHSQDDFMTEDCENKIITHVVNEIELGGEYTVCGRAIPDSSLETEDWERIGASFLGSIRKCDCKDCVKIIKYYKSLR